MLEAILLLLLTLTDVQEEQGSSPVEWTRELVIETIHERSVYWGANPAQTLRVGSCETGGSYSPYRTGSHGEKGVGQWLPPSWKNHWGRTPAWTAWHIDIVGEYQVGNPDAVWTDIDNFAWSFGREAPAGNYLGWSCR